MKLATTLAALSIITAAAMFSASAHADEPAPIKLALDNQRAVVERYIPEDKRELYCSLTGEMIELLARMKGAGATKAQAYSQISQEKDPLNTAFESVASIILTMVYETANDAFTPANYRSVVTHSCMGY